MSKSAAITVRIGDGTVISAGARSTKPVSSWMNILCSPFQFPYT